MMKYKMMKYKMMKYKIKIILQIQKLLIMIKMIKNRNFLKKL